MGDNFKRQCVKCGRSPREDPDIKLYRFPKPGPTNILRCELWAKYCFPQGSWSSVDYQQKLYGEHRMLCSLHFKRTSFTDFAEKKLNRHAVPDENVEATGVQLQRLCQNTKTRQQQAMTMERQKRLAAGGGGPCPDANIDLNVADIAPALLVEIPEGVDSDMSGQCIHKFNVGVVQDQDITLEGDHPQQSEPSTSIQSTLQSQPPVRTVQIEETSQLGTEETEPELSSSEEKLRFQILQNEYLNRERRAHEIHMLQVEYLRNKNKLELKILEQQLLEAQAKVELAKKNTFCS